MLHVGNQKGRIKGEKMKAVLISVRPKWCELIASGKKRIEVRKTRPKIETPFKCYIYKSFGKRKDCFAREIQTYFNCGKVIGEFVCDRIICCQAYYDDSGKRHLTNLFGVDTSEICLSESEMFDYIIGKNDTGWLWHISDLKIYDKAKLLIGFSYYAEHDFTKRTIKESREMGFICHGAYITRPPQSWCYVEEI